MASASDYALYPGKMDHSTVVACVVGEVQLPDDAVHDVATFRPSGVCVGPRGTRF